MVVASPTMPVMPAMPAMPETPAAAGRRRLSAAERAVYDEQGYVLIPNVIPPDELEAVDREIDRLLEEIIAQRRAQGQTQWENDRDASGSILQLGMRSPVCQQMAEDARVLDLVEAVVKPGIAIYSVKLIAKPPFSQIPCHWHQDDAYYVQASQSETRMSVWIPLQDAHERYGCLWVVPGSHLWGLQEHARKDYGLCSYSMDDAKIQAILDEQAIPVPVPAGSAVLFSALLWHGSKGNDTGAVRRAFITSYQEATVPQGTARQWRIVRPAPAG